MAKVLNWIFYGYIIVFGPLLVIGALIKVPVLGAFMWSMVFGTIAGQVVVGILIAAAILTFIRHLSH
jgi:hypothetical protein